MVLINNSTLFIIISLLGLFPTFAILRYYRITHIFEFLILGMGFLTISIQGFLLALLSSRQDSLILQQLDDMLYSTWLMLLLVHGTRLYWYKTPKKVKIMGFVWYFLLLLAPLFYKMIDLPEKGSVIFIEMKNTSPLESGQMFKIGDVYIIGQGFDFLVQLFRIYAFLILAMVYSKSKNIAQRLNVERERKIFIISIIFALILPVAIILELLWFPISFDQEILHVFDVLALIGIGITTIFAPETVLISQVQILRVTNQRMVFSERGSVTDLQNKPIEISRYIEKVKELYPEIMKSRNR